MIGDEGRTDQVAPVGSTIGRRRFIALTGVGATGMFAGCTSGSGDQTGTKGSGDRSGGHLRVTSPRTLTTISPIHTPSKFTNLIATRMLYSQLSWLDYDMNRHDELATNWEVQNNEKNEWVVELRDNVKFNNVDGTLGAKDVVATYNTILKGDYPGKGSLGGVDSASVVDDHTVNFKLTRGNADFPMFGAKGWTSIVPKSVIENDLESLNTTDYGSGPFNLEAYPSESELVLRRNPDFYMKDSGGNALPYIDKLTMATVEDNSTAITQLQNKESDIDRRTDISQYSRVKGQPNMDPVISSGGTFVAFVMDNAVEPWNDSRVRKAVKLSINRGKFVRDSIQGVGRIANDSVLAPLYQYYKQFPQRKQNVEKAKNLLANAGYPNGFHLTEDFDITFYTPTQPAHQLNSAILFKEQLKQIGVGMDLKQLSYDQFVSEVWGSAPSYCTSYGTKFNENSLLSRLIHSDGSWWSENHWKNKEKDRAIEKAAKTTDPQKRKKLYAKVQKLMYEEGPYAIPYFVDTFGTRGAGVRNWERHPLYGQDQFQRVRLDSNA